MVQLQMKSNISAAAVNATSDGGVHKNHNYYAKSSQSNTNKNQHDKENINPSSKKVAASIIQMMQGKALPKL